MRETEKLIFFIDRALGKDVVANALRNAGALVEVHDDHFAPNAPDTDWLPDVSQRGWIVITRECQNWAEYPRTGRDRQFRRPGVCCVD